jgi:hypothetical protein
MTDGLHGVEGCLDMSQMADAVDELVCSVWEGDSVLCGNRRAEAFRRLDCRLAEFVEEATLVQIFWEEASLEADLEGQDFVQKAIVLGRGFPEAEWWQRFEPLEQVIAAFVQRVAVGGYGGFGTEVAGNLVLLATVVGNHIRQARLWQESLQSVRDECLGGG